MEKEYVKQTGLLFKFSDKDFIAGSNSPIVAPKLNELSDWRVFLPVGEPQYLYAKFDTMSCTTFSALNIIETFCNFLLAQKTYFTEDQVKTLTSLGYIINGQFNFSDRFTAIVSNTTELGNYFQNVLDSIRNIGAIPEKDLPFGGKTWSEYHNKSLITQSMLDKAKIFKNMIEVKYEWTIVGDNLQEDLKQCPIQCAIPATASHAVVLPKLDYIFDSYPPYLYKRNTVIAYAMKIYVSIKKYENRWKYFKPTEKTGNIGNHTIAELDPEFVDLMDKMRGECGFAWKINSGYRTPAENNTLKESVNDSAHCDRIAVDIACTDSTKRQKILDVVRANGINRIGIATTFIHIDIAKDKPQNVTWVY